MFWAQVQAIVKSWFDAATSGSREENPYARDEARRGENYGRLASGVSGPAGELDALARVGHPGEDVLAARFEIKDLRRYLLETPLLASFILSLIIHLCLYGGWSYGKSLGWWNHQATWLLNLTRKVKPAAQTMDEIERLAAQRKEIPMTFVEVDPARASEPPPDAKYYSLANTLAANPDPQKDTSTPKLDGKQDKVVKLETVPRPEPLQVQTPQPAPAPPKLPPPEPPGDLAKMNPDAMKRPSDGVADLGMTDPGNGRTRPRTLREARAQSPSMAGEAYKQDGGVKRRGRVSLDVKATPFGSYDSELVAAVQQRWYELIDSTQLSMRAGKVVLEFRLHYDGRVSDLKVGENEVGDLLALLCQRAVMDPSPFRRWPSDMWRMVGKNYREVLFTFYYN
jgi:hypothetical protein